MSEQRDRIEHFVTTLKSTAAVYILANQEALCITNTNQESEQDMLLAWSELALVEAELKHWPGFKVLSLDISEFTDLLEDLAEDGIYVGLDLSDEQIAIELTAEQCLNELNHAN